MTTVVNLVVLNHLYELPRVPALTPPPLPPQLELPTEVGGWRRLLAAQAARHAHLLRDLGQSMAFVRKNLHQAQEV